MLVTLLLLVSPLAAAQSGGAGPSPERLWSYGTGEASVNEIAITRPGTAGAAVLSDASGSNQNDGEICPWDLTRNPRSSDTAWPSCADPTEGLLLSAEGMRQVAVHPKPSSSDVLIAAGNEGTSEGNQNNIYVYSMNAGSGSDAAVTYQDDGGEEDNGPTGAVQDLIFLDGDTLLAWHEGTLSLLKRQSGQQFHEANDGRWSPASGSITAIDVSADGSRILVGVEDGSATQIYLLAPEGSKLMRVSNDEQLSDKGAPTAVGLNANASYAVLGTADRWVYYYQIVNDTTPDADETDEGEDREWNFSASPYSAQGDGAVTALDVSPDGERFVVGFNGGTTTLFEQTIVEDDGPRAATAGTFEGQRSPSDIQFAQDGNQLYITGGGLFAFHARQFQDGGDFDPIWSIATLNDAVFSDDGQRFLASRSNTVLAYQQAYEAKLTLDGASQLSPGQPTSWQIGLANTGSTYDTYELSVDGAPNSWTTDFNRSEVGLLPGASTNVTLNLTPDAKQAPTNVTLTIKATSSASPDGAVAGSVKQKASVPVVRGASVTVPDDRAEARQGEPVEILADLANTGNTNGTITLEVSQDKSWDVQIEGQAGDTADLALEPGDNQTVSIELTVPAEAAEGSSNEVTLTARPSAGGTEDTATVTLLVEPSFGGTLSVPSEPLDAEPGSQKTAEITVQNTGNTVDSYQLRVFSNATNPDHLWRATLSETTVEVPADGSQTVDVTVTVPRGAETGEATDITITARSTTTDEKVDEATFTLQVPEDTEDSPFPLFAVPLALALVALARRRTS